MTEKKPESEWSRPNRRDRDELVLKLLGEHPEWVPTQQARDLGFPKESMEPLRLGMVNAGWVEYPKSPERSKLPSASLRQTLGRLVRKGQLPPALPGRPPGWSNGKKVAPKSKAAAKVAKLPTQVIRVTTDIDKAKLVIEAARTGLRVRILTDGTIEVQP